MINSTSPITSTAVAYSGGAASTSQPGFGAALTAKLAELQAASPVASLCHQHHGRTGVVNQDAGNQSSGRRLAKLETGAGPV
jgi:hypothetical protein